jgi:pyridoxal phosphate enzyme (YggS family)
MLIDYKEFVLQAEKVRQQIAEACARAGRTAGSVELLAVTKTHPPLAADYVARLGLTSVGENRVQEGVEKRAQASPAARALRWELIGHLQTNKAKLAAQHFDRIQSVDSEKLLNHLDRAAADAGKVLPILLQINAGNDPAKFGAEPAEAARLLETALGKTHLRVDGLMTIAPLGASAEETVIHAERTFSNLRILRDDLAARFGCPLRELSMGMTGDLAIAIAAGSTLVRVGTALFGARESPGSQ